MKKIASFITFFAILLFITCFPKTSYAVDQLVFEGPTLDTPYEGQTQISGYLAGFGTLPSGEKVPVSTFDGAAWIQINDKTYNAMNSGNQMFNYTVTKVDEDNYSFTFTLPDNITLKEGDRITNFVIPANVENPSNYPQMAHKFSGEYIVQKKVEPQPSGEVFVLYLDEKGDEISSRQRIPGLVGDSYDATTEAYKLAIAGYTLDETKLPINATGTISSTPQLVVYRYQKNPVKAHGVTVHYIDEVGNELAASKTISGLIGEPYDASTDAYKLVIDGYTLDKTKLPTNAVGTLSDLDQVVTYTYKKNQQLAQDLIVQYVDEHGQKLLDPKMISGMIGTPYDVTTKEYKLIIAGYTLDETKLPTNAIGTLTDTQQTVTYHYIANTESGKTTDTDHRESGKAITQKNTSSNNRNNLPKAGETITRPALFLGMSLIIISSLIYLFKKKMIKNQ